MLRSKPSISDEAGTASLEFVTTGLLLLLPIIYLVLTMSALQAGSLAVEGAARQAVRVFVQSPNQDEAARRTQRAVEFALADHGLGNLEPKVSITCTPQPGDCLRRYSRVTVSVSIQVALPLTPPMLTLQIPVAVPVEATATEQVSRFWGAP